MDTTTLISIELIDPNPFQPRKLENPDDIAALAADIEHHATADFDGLLEPPIVRAVNGRYELAFGHTRKAAFARLADQGKNRYRRMPAFIHKLNDLQMFEFATAENIRRRDLNPIEEAESMHQYMTGFGKTSVEAGEFFGVSEETVRGKVRLLGLVPAARTALADGEVSIPTSRTLLQLQKIAPPEFVVETVKAIKKNPDAHPDEVIEAVITRNLKGIVVTLFDEDRQSGKPKAGQNGWPLDMKNFPVKLLPHLTPVDIALALGIQDDGRLLAMLEVAHQNLDAGTWENALKQAFADEDPALLQKIEHLLKPPACNACPFYTKIRGSHFCGIQTCFDRKTKAWRTNLIQMASKSLKIAIYQPSDGKYKELDYNHTKLFTSRNKNLRLLPRDQWKGNGYVYQGSYEGVSTDVFIVVATGDAIEKLSVGNRGNAGGKKTEAEKAEMRRMKIYRVRRKELLWEFTGIARNIFKGVPAAAVKQLEGWKFIGIDDRIRPEWEPEKGASEKDKAEFKKRELVWSMIADECSHYRREKLADVLKRLQKRADEWGVKIPESLVEKVGQWDAEIEAAGKGNK